MHFSPFEFEVAVTEGSIFFLCLLLLLLVSSVIWQVLTVLVLLIHITIPFLATFLPKSHQKELNLFFFLFFVLLVLKLYQWVKVVV